MRIATSGRGGSTRPARIFLDKRLFRQCAGAEQLDLVEEKRSSALPSTLKTQGLDLLLQQRAGPRACRAAHRRTPPRGRASSGGFAGTVQPDSSACRGRFPPRVPSPIDRLHGEAEAARAPTTCGIQPKIEGIAGVEAGAYQRSWWPCRLSSRATRHSAGLTAHAPDADNIPGRFKVYNILVPTDRVAWTCSCADSRNPLRRTAPAAGNRRRR